MRCRAVCHYARVNWSASPSWPQLKPAPPGFGDKLSPTSIYHLPSSSSPARDDFDYFQPVARVEPPLGKFRRRDRLAVVLHDDAARQQVLRDQKFLNRARQLRLDGLSVGGDKRIHGFTVFSTSNIQHPIFVRWTLGVGCSMLDVFHFTPSAPRPSPSTPVRTPAAESPPPLRRRSVRRQFEIVRSRLSRGFAAAPIRWHRMRVPQSGRA